MLHVIFSEIVLIDNVDESNLGSKDFDSIQHFSFGPDEKSLTIPWTASTLLLLHKGVVLLPLPFLSLADSKVPIDSQGRWNMEGTK